MAINIDTNTDGDITYENPPVNRVLFPNIKYTTSPEEIQEAVDTWLDDHPEATTTVQDGSILPVKLDSSNDAADGYVLSWNNTAGKFEWVNVQADINELRQDLSHTTDYLLTGYKKIATAYIASNGTVTSGGSYDTHCFQVNPDAVINKITDSGAIVYAFFASEPSVNSISYNNSRTVLNVNEVTNITVPSGCNWIAVRSPSNGTVSISPVSATIENIKNTIVENKSELDAKDSEISEKIEDLDTDYFHRLDFALYNWNATAGEVPTVGTSTSRFRTSTYYHFRKGETISVKWSGLQMFLIYCDKDGVGLNIVGSWVESITFDQDRYAYFNFKSDNVSSFANNLYKEYAYFVHMVDASKSIWNGKTWYSFGTSMSDINTDGTTGNNGTLGKWPLVVDELSGASRTNEAIGSGGIVPSASHGGNVKTNIMACPYDVDLVTFECGLNDWGTIDLGEIGDKTDDTFIGNFTQCIEYLTYHTRAKVVFISMVPTTYTDYATGTRRDVFWKNSFGKTYREYVDAMIRVCQNYGVEVIDAEGNAMSAGRRNKQTIIDTIHFTNLGGQIFGRYVWSKLKDILPMPVIPEALT